MSNIKGVSVKWSIKGYHIFQRRPLHEIMMMVETEDNNPVDPSAMIVVMPDMEDIFWAYRGMVTRPSSRGRPQQTVEDIAGKVIGRVPANLCKFFRALIAEGIMMGGERGMLW